MGIANVGMKHHMWHWNLNYLKNPVTKSTSENKMHYNHKIKHRLSLSHYKFSICSHVIHSFMDEKCHRLFLLHQYNRHYHLKLSIAIEIDFLKWSNFLDKWTNQYLNSLIELSEYFNSIRKMTHLMVKIDYLSKWT